MALRKSKKGNRIITQKVEVSITHGDLGNAKYPVAVGHHLGDGLVSAEWVLNHYLEGRLYEKHKMGIYPGELETSEIILEPEAHPPGAIVIGLGNFGELNAGGLARGIGHGVLNAALTRKEQIEHGTLLAAKSKSGISPLLIGSGFGGLTIRAALKGILLGVQTANRRISELGVAGVEQIGAIEFIELYEDRAIQAAHILHSIISEERFDMFIQKTIQIRKVSGGRRRIMETPGDDWWHRLKVDGERSKQELRGGEPSPLVPLKFTSLTDRARAVVNNVATQRALVDQLVAESSKNSKWDRGMAQTMFELLVPNDFKDYVSDKGNILWILDKKSAEYPWELLYDPSLGSNEPLSVKSGMLRQLSVADYRLKPTAPENWALVIGDTVSNFSELPFAQEEAEMVSEILEGSGLKVAKLKKAPAPQILKSLFEHKYKVLHLATHGVFKYGKAEITGMVLDHDTYLTPAEIEQMRYVPDLVFINCCHLGHIEEKEEYLAVDRHRLAANLGTQLIQMGVKAVVVAGWAVMDHAAETFARVFYEKMKAGENFGDAIHKARSTVFHKKEYKNYNTWGAYQCYGDPYFKLTNKSRKKKEAKKQYIDPLEAIIDLENIINQVEPASSRSFRRLQGKLKTTVNGIPQKWMKDGKLLEAIAIAYSDLELFEEAIRVYSQALALERATFSLKSLEQFANLKARWGSDISLIKTHKKYNPEKGKALILEGINELEGLMEISKTSERFSLMGSALKRLALVSDTYEQSIEALTRSGDFYKQAFFHKRNLSQFDNYPLVNWIMVGALLEWEGVQTLPSKKELDGILKEGKEMLKKEISEEATFWNLATEATFSQFSLLRAGKTKDTTFRDSIINSNQKAWKFGGSYKKRDSVLDQFRFLILMLEKLKAKGKEKEKAALVKELREIEGDVTKIMKDN